MTAVAETITLARPRPAIATRQEPDSLSQNNIGSEFRTESAELIAKLQESLAKAILTTDDRIALPPGSAAALADFYEPLADSGDGAAATIDRLIELAEAAGGNTPGPRCFHFVIGGSTPAALAADLLATAYEQVTYTWVDRKSVV